MGGMGVKVRVTSGDTIGAGVVVAAGDGSIGLGSGVSNATLGEALAGVKMKGEGVVVGSDDGEITRTNRELDGEEDAMGVLVGPKIGLGDEVGQLEPPSSTNSMSRPRSLARSTKIEHDTHISRRTPLILAHLSKFGHVEDDEH